MFKDLWSQVPTAMKYWFVFCVVIGFGGIGFGCYGLVHFALKFW